MKFQLPSGATFEIDDHHASGDVIDILATRPEIDAEIAELAKNSGFHRFEESSDFDQGTADDIAEAFFEGGREAAESAICEIVDRYDNGPEQYLYEVMKDGGELDRLLEAVAEPIAEATGEDQDAVADLFFEAMKGRICEKLDEFDDSKPFDIVPGNVRVEVMRILGADGSKSIEDELALTDYVSNVFCLQSMMPGDGIKTLFEAANIGIEEFAAYVSEEYGVDLRGGPKNKDLVAWLAQGDYIRRADDPRVLADAAARAIAWAAFEPVKDPDLPVLLPVEKFGLLFSEATYGGLPVYVARISLADIVDFDWSQPLLMGPSRGQTKSGGFIGIYNPWNGSGDIEAISHPIPLPAGREGWKVSGKYGHAVDDVFGIVGHHYHATPSVDERRLRMDVSAGPSI